VEKSSCQRGHRDQGVRSWEVRDRVREDDGWPVDIRKKGN
jgi:hypothetical protein